MTTRVQVLLDAAEQLSPVEQLELIQALSQSLQRHYQPAVTARERGDAIPVDVPRTRPVTDLGEMAADFWPAEESADDITTFLAQQRAMDRTSDL